MSATSPGFAQTEPVPATSLDGAVDARDGVTDAILAIARGADHHDWQAVAATFADSVMLDYGSPERLTPQAIVARWQPLLEAFDSTRHELRDIEPRIHGDRATATSQFLATHVLAGSGAPMGDVWTLEGRYEHELQRSADGQWRVTAMRMIPSASTGNQSLLAEAQALAASRAAARARSAE